MQFKKILDKLGYIKGKVNLKEFATLFVIVLIPEIMRHLAYYFAQLKTNTIGFIASFETRVMYSASFPIAGILEEIIIGFAYITLWFKFRKLRFLTYAWIADVAFDFISVISFILIGATPLQLLGLPLKTRFLLREIIFFYVIIGPLLMKYKIDIKKFAIGTAILGAFTILLCI
ncbi:MAG: hypothetical protein J7K73_03290 [Nanoarchaeota archaeon]|nr:hypothetical protein [Nanoarchaeota archaeon]